MLLRRALRRAGNVRRCRQKSSSPKEDPCHNRATAMNFEEGESWLQRLVGTTGRTTTEFERYKAAAKAAVKTDAGLTSGDELRCDVGRVPPHVARGRKGRRVRGDQRRVDSQPRGPE